MIRGGGERQADAVVAFTILAHTEQISVPFLVIVVVVVVVVF